MKILYVALRADFGADGDISKGLSYEASHFEPSFDQLEKEGLISLEKYYLDIDKSTASLQALVENSKRGCYDAIFTFPVTHALSIHLPYAAEILKTGTPIIQFHCDPLRRWNEFVLSSWREKYFSHAVIPAPHMLKHYQKEGIPTSIMHFGAPDWCDRTENGEKIYDVSFVGQQHGLRQQVVNSLRQAGIRVHTFGHFWGNHIDSHPRVSDEQMNLIFNQTKINLNLTWISQPPYQHQIKGRHSELMAAGAFQIATYGKEEMEGIEDIGVPGEDFIQVYTVNEMIDKIKYYYQNDKEREIIADNGYQKRDQILGGNLLRKWFKENFNNGSK